MSEKRKLKKELGVFSATSVVVGCVIGAGVFFSPTQSIRQPEERQAWECWRGSSGVWPAFLPH